MFSYGHLHLDTPMLANQEKLIHQFCADTGCHLEDLPLGMDSERERDSVKGICVVSTSWWMINLIPKLCACLWVDHGKEERRAWSWCLCPCDIGWGRQVIFFLFPIWVLFEFNKETHLSILCYIVCSNGCS